MKRTRTSAEAFGGMIGVVLLAAGVAACSGDERPSTPQPTNATSIQAPTSTHTAEEVPTASDHGGGGGGHVSTTPVANPTPLPPPDPIPATWKTFRQGPGLATEGFSLSLPPGWFASPPPPAVILQSNPTLGWTFTSWDPAAPVKDVAVPPLGALKIDITSLKLGHTGAACSLAADSPTRLAGGDATFGISKPAPGDTSTVDTAYAFRLKTSAAEYCISALVTKGAAAGTDPAKTLSQILSSLRFGP